MTRKLVAAAAVVVFGTGVFLPALPAGAQCPTQGALALALAQLLGYEVTAQGVAAGVLAGIGVRPAAGWKPEACLDEGVVVQVEAALKKAVAEKLVRPDLAEGAVAAALASLGAGDLVAALERALPRQPFAGGAALGGPPAERRYPEASPFLPPER